MSAHLRLHSIAIQHTHTHVHNTFFSLKLTRTRTPIRKTLSEQLIDNTQHIPRRHRFPLASIIHSLTRHPKHEIAFQMCQEFQFNNNTKSQLNWNAICASNTMRLLCGTVIFHGFRVHTNNIQIKPFNRGQSS